MFGLRQFIRSGRFSRLLALWVAYSIAIQALMASVGLGMSAFAAPGLDGFAVCSHASAGVPAPAGGQQNPSPSPPCPFCYVAAQSAGHIALATPSSPVPVYAESVMAAVSDRAGEPTFIPHFRGMVGAPRAPPAFSV